MVGISAKHDAPARTYLADPAHWTVIPVTASVEVLIHNHFGVGGVFTVGIVEKTPIDDVPKGGACRLSRCNLYRDAGQVAQLLNVMQGAVTGRLFVEHIHRRYDPRARSTRGAPRTNRPPIAPVENAKPSRRILPATAAGEERVLSRPSPGIITVEGFWIEGGVEIMHHRPQRNRGVRR